MSRINLNEIEDYLDDEYGYESFERIKSDKPRENSKSDILLINPPPKDNSLLNSKKIDK